MIPLASLSHFIYYLRRLIMPGNIPVIKSATEGKQAANPVEVKAPTIDVEVDHKALASRSPESSLESSLASQTAQVVARLRLEAEERALLEEKQRLELEKLEAEVRQLELAEKRRTLEAKKAELLGRQREAEAEEARRATYTKEREDKLREAKANEFKDAKSVGEFLKYIAEGEQDKAEVMLQKTPALALHKGTVMDLSKREFKAITGFQYALWALDWHMWKMLLKYMPEKEAAMQFQELEEKGTAHGKHFSLWPLIEATDAYVQNYNKWIEAGAYDKIKAHWCEQVGGAQLLLPAHVINEYCHPTRPLSPCPTFTEDTLPRSMKVNEGEWFTVQYRGGTLGIKFGVFRSSAAEARGLDSVGLCSIKWVGMNGAPVEDSRALQALTVLREKQLKDLKANLGIGSDLSAKSGLGMG
jgi:hypothetical protein